jgi:hypothetical protein
MGAKGKSLLTSPLVTALICRLVHAYCRTLSLKVENEAPWLAHLQAGGKVLLCLWHQQLFGAIRQTWNYSYLHPSIMISQSQDGELVARFVESIDWVAVRGSSSRGGQRALKEMIRRVRETGFAAHILDGPQGPLGKVKSGVIHLAQATGAVLVPLCATADRAWYLKSWDRCMVPKPFARITMRFGEMIQPLAAESEEDLEKQRQRLEAVMTPYLTP